MSELDKIREKAEQGDAESQFQFGGMYALGEDVPKNDKEAVKWYLNAANQGHPKAQYNLAVMYSRGIGVVKDDIEAYAWALVAKANGYQDRARVKVIAYCEKLFTPEQREKGQARAKELYELSSAD